MIYPMWISNPILETTTQIIILDNYLYKYQMKMKRNLAKTIWCWKIWFLRKIKAWIYWIAWMSKKRKMCIFRIHHLILHRCLLVIKKHHKRERWWQIYWTMKNTRIAFKKLITLQPTNLVLYRILLKMLIIHRFCRHWGLNW